MRYGIEVFATPVGEMMTVTDASGALVRLDFVVDRSADEIIARIAADDDLTRRDATSCEAAVRQMGEYFRGERRVFELDLAPRGTDFQQQVWSELLRIPWGVTISYAQLAERIGNPRAIRAVGGANGRNPIAIVVPCHRVIGADGSLTGYASGVEIKRSLLEVEGALAPTLSLGGEVG